MIQGLRTVIYHVPDLEKARTWYSRLLGIEPYFAEPFYVGFNVGGFELGLDPDTEGTHTEGSVVAYWGVADAEAAYARLLKEGAVSNKSIQDVGEGIKVASVKDPFGNVFGIIENPHFEINKVK